MQTSGTKGAHRPGDSSDTLTSLSSVPVTQERVPFTGWDKIPQAGVARVNIAVTEDSPDGAKSPEGYKEKHADQTVLQQHCDFFDLNSDGIITPFETYVAFRLLEWSIFLSLFATMVIHGGFSWFTLPPGHWLPDPFFRIYLCNIHSAKHGSDSGTYDHEGRFRAQQFADFFSKYGKQMSDGEWGITFSQALHGAKSQRCIMDAFGTFAEFFEWTATYLTIWPADGIMRMEDVRGVYDGSYFFKVAGKRRDAYIRGGWFSSN